MEEKAFGKLPGCAEAFIGQVIRKMRYRRVRREVQRELTDHFLDLLADVEDAAERERAAAEHVAAFGDSAVLGKLLRRAKKRCRPWWRTAVVRMFQTAGAVMGLFIVYLVWFFSGRPVITTNYVEELNRLTRPTVEAEQNAEPYYRKAAEAYVKCETEAHRSPQSIPLAALSPDEKESIRKWLEDNAESIEAAAAGSKMPYYAPTYETQGDTSEMIAVLMPHLSDYCNLGRAMLWKARLAAAEGDMESAVTWLGTAWLFGKHLTGDRTLIEQLVAFSIEANTAETVRLILAEGGLDGAALEHMQETFGGLVTDDCFLVSFAGEKMFMYDEIQRSFTSSRLGKSHLYVRRIGHVAPLLSAPADASWPRMLWKVLFTHPSKEDTLAAGEAFYGCWDWLRVMTPYEQKQGETELIAEIDHLTNRNLFLNMLAPAFGKVIATSHQIKADAEATLAVLGVSKYKQQNGEYPASLRAAAEAGYLAAVPMDPYSDEPLVYRRTDRGFTLYSVGPDFADDGGEPGLNADGKPRLWADKGDTVFWPIQAPLAGALN